MTGPRVQMDDESRRRALQEWDELYAAGKVRDQDIDAFMSQRGVQPRQSAPDQPVAMPSMRVPRAASESTTGPIKPRGPSTDFGEDVRGAARAASQGLTFGFADEIEAGARSLAGQGEYKGIRDDIRGADEKFRELNPKLGNVAEVAGGLLPVSRIGGLVRKAPQAAGAAMGAMKRLGRSAATGAGFGALTAAGKSEEVDDMAGNAASGAAGGAAFGAALPAVASGIKGGTNVVRDISEHLTRKPNLDRARTNATSKIAEALARDQESPLSASTSIWQKEQAGFPSAVVDAGGKNMRNLANVVYMTPGEGSTVMDRFARARSAGSAERLASGVERTGKARAQNLNELKREIAERRSKEAAPLYQQAFANKQPLSLPKEVWDELQNPDISKGWATGQRLHRLDEPGSPAWKEPAQALFKKSKDEHGRVINELTRAPTTQDIDWIKRGLDREIEKALAKTNGVPNQVSRLYSKAKDRIMTATREANPTYAKALDTWEGESRLIGLVEDGKRFLRLGDDDFSDLLSKVRNKDELEVLRKSALNSIGEGLRNKEGRNTAFNILQDPKARRRIEALYPDAKSYKQLRELVDAEIKGYELTRRMTGQSQTAENAMNIFDFTGGPTVPTSAKQGLTHLLTRGIQRARGTAGEAEAGEVARLLTQGGKEGQDWLESLLEFAERERRKGARASGIGGAAAGSVAGRMAGGG